MKKIRLISFNKDDYKVFFEKHLRGSFKIFLYTSILLNLILALPIHLLSGGLELKIYGNIRCNMFVVCTMFSLMLLVISLLSGYWCVINNLNDNLWVISVASLISFGAAYSYFTKICTWQEEAIVLSIFVSLCITYIVIKCCK